MIIVFDGGCGLCKKLKQLLHWLDWFNIFEVRSLHEEKLYKEFPQLVKADCEIEMKLILKNGEIMGGSDALIRICFYLPLLFWWGFLWWLPPFKQFARRLYPLVANNRHRISASCSLD